MLWTEARPQVCLDDGILVLDDSTLDKPYAWKMDLVGWHWSGKHHRVVKGINLLTLVWTDGDRHVPCDYDIYDKAHDGFSKNDLFAQQLRTAKARGMKPQCVCFDSWFSSLENLKLLRSLQWTWLGRLKSNRQVRVDFGARVSANTSRTADCAHADICQYIPNRPVNPGTHGWAADSPLPGSEADSSALSAGG
jgi:hypothetical protein